MTVTTMKACGMRPDELQKSVLAEVAADQGAVADGVDAEQRLLQAEAAS